MYYDNYMYYAYFIIINFFLCRFRAKRAKPRDLESIDTASDSEDEAGDDSVLSKGSSHKGSSGRYNSKGMLINSNNVISLRHLALANQFPSKTRDEGTEKCFSAALNLSKAYTLFTLIVNGCKMPVEKQRDGERRMILHSGSVLLEQRKHRFYLGSGSRRAQCLPDWFG